MYATTAWQAEALNGADEQGEQVLTRTPTDLLLVAASSQLLSYAWTTSVSTAQKEVITYQSITVTGGLIVCI